MRDLVILVFVISAFWALLVSGRRRARRAAYVWGIASLGAVAGLILNSAAESRPEVTNTVVTHLNPPPEGTRVSEPTPVVSPPPTIPRPPPPEPKPTDQQLEPSVPKGVRESVAPPPVVSVDRRPEPASIPPHVERGGVSVVIRGNWSPLDPSEVESAVLSGLQNARWNGFTSGGEKVLTINGTLRDLDLTLGQVPTATVSAHWSLRSARGNVLIAQGGLSDVRGTGLEQSAAQVEAVQRAARQLAHALAGNAP